MTQTKAMREARETATADLKAILQPGDTVYTVLRNVSRSGMTRHVDVYVIRDNEPRRITWHVARALGWTYSTQREALTVNGCGMDMGFHTVYSLSAVLFGYDDRGAYALSHRWL